MISKRLSEKARAWLGEPTRRKVALGREWASLAYPEATYRLAIQRLLVVSLYRRFIPGVSLVYAIECEEGIPFPTARGEDAVYTADIRTWKGIKKAVKGLDALVTRYRMQFGKGEGWRPVRERRKTLTEARLGPKGRKAVRNLSKGRRTFVPINVCHEGKEYQVHADRSVYERVPTSRSRLIGPVGEHENNESIAFRLQRITDPAVTEAVLDEAFSRPEV